MSTGVHRRHRRFIGCCIGIALLAAACASDPGAEPAESSDPGAEPAEPADTQLVDAADLVPERIVSLSPTHTEILFAIGAGDLLVAVDDFSDYPPEATELPNDLSGFEPNVEAIASFEPDLVITGGDFTGLGEQLATLGVDGWDGPAAATIEDMYAQIEQLGELTGRSAEAGELTASMRSRISELVAAAPTPAEPLSLYHELDSTLYSADSSTFIGEVYELFGLRNIADAAEGDAPGFPQLNAEFIVSANPDLIFLADTKCCEQSAVTVAARPGWDAIAAVQNGNVVAMDDDVASRWGPRVVDYVEAVASAVAVAATTGDSG